MEATTIQNSIIECGGNTVVMASPGSGKTFVISEKIKKILGDDSMLNYQGVIAISYTRKASGGGRRDADSHSGYRGDCRRKYYRVLQFPGKHPDDRTPVRGGRTSR